MTKPRALLVLALALATIVAACGASSPTSTPLPPTPTPAAQQEYITVDLNAAYDLRVGQRSELRGAFFLVEILGVGNDSRCPVDVVCIRAGDAAISLRIRTSVEASQDVALVFPTPDKASAQLGAYRIAVTGLAPAPRAGQPISQSAYIVTLVISPA